MNSQYDWSRRFDEPIELSNGHRIVTLRDAVTWLVETVPKDQHGTTELRALARALSEAAQDGSMLLANISMIQAIERHQPGMLMPNRAESDAEQPELSSTPDQHSTGAVASELPSRGGSLGIGRLFSNRKYPRRARLLAATSQKPVQASEHDPTILSLLEHVRTAGGSVYWKEGNEPALAGLHQAVELGYLVRFSGATHEGITLTRRARIALGMEAAPSLLTKLAKQLGWSYPRPLAKILGIYREFIARRLRRGQSSKQQTTGLAKRNSDRIDK
jgi:hypothetical protein